MRARAARLAAAALLSAALYALSTGLGTWWPLAWVAPLPVLLVALDHDGVPARHAAAVAFAAYLGGELRLVPYLGEIVPPLVLAVLLGAVAAAFALVVAASRALGRRLGPAAAALPFPLLWTTYEWAVSRLSPHGTALSVAYSQARVPPVLQLAAVTGVVGITFVLSLVPSAIAVAWRRRAAGGVRAPLALAAGALGITLAYGAARLVARPPGAAPVAVGLAANDATISATDDVRPGVAVGVARDYARRVRALAGRGADLVVLPEKLAAITPTDSAAVVDTVRAAAVDGRVLVVVGLNRMGPRPWRNLALAIAPDGAVRAYDKAHPIPGLESAYTAGRAPLLLAGAGTELGVAICKDMDFPAWTRRYAGGARLLAVPAWDFGRDARLHADMATARGVEGGFAIARAAADGLLTLTDDRGRVLAERATRGGSEVLLLGTLPPGGGATPYARWGDWFAWLCVAGLALVTRAALRGSRTPAARLAAARRLATG